MPLSTRQGQPGIREQRAAAGSPENHYILRRESVEEVNSGNFASDKSAAVLEGVQLNLMKLKFVCSLAAAAALMSAAAFAQAGSSTAALPSAPGAASDPVATAPATGVKIAAINVEAAIANCNEGLRDYDALEKKLEPKQNQLKAQNDEIEALKKKAGAASTPEAEKADVQRQIDTKQKALERDAQDAQEDARGQYQEIAQRILGKMAPIIIKYATENGYGMIIDTSTSNQWPNGPVLWHGPALDITKAVVDTYNVQSGVAPPPKPAASSAPSHPAGTTAKPATSTTPKQ